MFCPRKEQTFVKQLSPSSIITKKRKQVKPILSPHFAQKDGGKLSAPAFAPTPTTEFARRTPALRTKTPIRTVGTGLPDGPPSDAGGAEEKGGGYDLASLREGGGAALAGMLLRFVYTPSRSRDGGSLRVMQLDFEFYKVFIKNQSLYSPIFLQDLILTIPLLDYPMAPSPLRGALPFRLNSRGASQSQIASSAPLRRDTPPQNGYQPF